MHRITQATPIAFADPLPDAVDIVVIGAGVVGTATAYFLARRGVKVLLCEKGRIAGEQSSRNWGWIRQQGRDQHELPIVMESLDLWQQIADNLDEDIGFRRQGSLYLCENDADMARNDRFMSFAPAYGLSTSRLNRGELEDLVKDCPARWQSGLYTPDDGRAEPSLAVPAMARRLRERGVDIRENCAVLEIVTRNAAVEEVVCEAGRVSTDAVLVAAGAWSTFLLGDCGIRLPQLTVKASVARTAPMPSIFDGNASGSQVAFRRRLDGGYSIACTDYLEVFPTLRQLGFVKDFLPLIHASLGKLKLRWPEVRAGRDYTAARVLDPQPSAKTAARIQARLAERVPAFDGVEIAETWSGLIDALPDVVPVLDHSPTIDGLWVSTGFSGHGFGIGPGAGRVMADLIQGKRVNYDLSRFRLARFSDGSRLEMGPSI